MFMVDSEPHVKFFVVHLNGRLILQKGYDKDFLARQKSGILWDIQVTWLTYTSFHITEVCLKLYQIVSKC